MSEYKVSADMATGVKAERDGKKLALALIDENGKIVASGVAVAYSVFSEVCKAYKAMWLGSGALRKLPA